MTRIPVFPILGALASLFMLSVPCLAQTNVDTEITAEQVFDLSVLEVYPDAFPNVEVVFIARDQDGKPLWDVQQSDLEVIENGQSCPVCSLTNISATLPIHMALVMDHSGSMGYPVLPDSMWQEDYVWTEESIAFFERQPLPMDLAKRGVLRFIEQADLGLDAISIVGFSSETDPIVGPTQDAELLEATANAMVPDMGTAFYDALMRTLDQVGEAAENKAALVTLTDGWDNESESTVEDVIAKAQTLDIPLYVIGLGDVSDSTLTQMAEETGGLYYPTDDPNQLEEIYLNIGRQLKSVYSLQYTSQVTDFEDGATDITFGFTHPHASFSNPNLTVELPEEARQYLEAQDHRKLERTLAFGGGAAGVVGLSAIGFLVYRRRKTAFQVVSLHPNPFTDALQVELSGDLGTAGIQVQVFDPSGNLAHTTHIQQHTHTLQLGHLPKGTYVISFAGSSGKPVSKRVVKG